MSFDILQLEFEFTSGKKYNLLSSNGSGDRDKAKTSINAALVSMIEEYGPVSSIKLA